MRTLLKIMVIVAIVLGLAVLAAGMLMTQVGALVEIDGVPFWAGDAGTWAIIALATGAAVLVALLVVALVLPLAVLVAGVALAFGLGLAVWVLVGVGGLVFGPLILIGLGLWWLASRLRLG